MGSFSSGSLINSWLTDGCWKKVSKPSSLDSVLAEIEVRGRQEWCPPRCVSWGHAGKAQLQNRGPRTFKPWSWSDAVGTCCSGLKFYVQKASRWINGRSLQILNRNAVFGSQSPLALRWRQLEEYPRKAPLYPPLFTCPFEVSAPELCSCCFFHAGVGWCRWETWKQSSRYLIWGTWDATHDCHAFKRQFYGHSQNRDITNIISALREKLTQNLLLVSHIFIVSQINPGWCLSLSHRFCSFFLLLLNYLLVQFWTQLINNSLGQNAAAPYACNVHATSSYSWKQFSMCLNNFFRNKMICCKHCIQILFCWGTENLQAMKSTVLTYERIKNKGTVVYEMHSFSITMFKLILLFKKQNQICQLLCCLALPWDTINFFMKRACTSTKLSS